MKREEPWLAPSVRRLLYSPCSRCECECSFQPLSDSKGMRTEAPLREAVRWIPGVVELEWGAGDASQPLQGILWKSHVTPRVEVTLLSNRPAGPAGHRSSQQKCMELRFSLSAQARQPPSMTPCTRPTLPPPPPSLLLLQQQWPWGLTACSVLGLKARKGEQESTESQGAFPVLGAACARGQLAEVTIHPPAPF